MLTKLRYVGVKTEDLIKLYCMYIKSLTEYYSTAFYSSLTHKLSNTLEGIPNACLRVILGVMYEYSWFATVVDSNELGPVYPFQLKQLKYKDP